MVDSFKNFERLRYRLSSDINHNVDELRNDSAESRNSVVNSILAIIFSAFFSEVAVGLTFDISNLWKELVRICAFVILYIISYYSCKRILEKRDMKNKENEGKEGSSDTFTGVNQCVKDFDNIACDSVLLAKGYMTEVLEVKDHLLQQFYYYEIMHYIETANTKINSLMINKAECIKRPEKASGVELFRLDNILDMEEEIYKFLKNHLDTFIGEKNSDYKTIEERLKTIKDQIKDFKDDVKNIRESSGVISDV